MKILATRLIATFAFILVFTSNGYSQCLSPAWSYCLSCYVAGDTVSYDGKDWELGSTGQGWRVPGSLTGPNYWVQLNTECIGPSEPSVAATEHRAVYCRTAFGIGTIDNDNGASITARGFVFGTSSGPTLDNANVLLDAGYGVGDEFEGLMENLTPETTYYVRTYATNSVGTSYGTEASFTTKADVECTDCNLACDETDPGLLNPSVTELNITYSIIGLNDTLCLTEDRSWAGSTVRGMLKLCNGAQITISGSMKVDTKELGSAYNGQVVYEGCNEKILGSGSYTGEIYAGTIGLPEHYDPKQMISYCATCDENDQSQFFQPTVATHLWAATCRPTTTLVTALPVELISFKLNPSAEGILLEWITGSEIDNSHFDVQVSYDGVNWTTIGIVQGAGNTNNETNYSFLDNQIGEGVQYYRLKQNDFNGEFAYSNIRHYSFDESSKPTSFIAFQNQSNQIEVQAIFSGVGNALLYDSRGRLVEEKMFITSGSKGMSLTFDNTNLSEGVYFVKIKSSNAVLGQKVQIIK